MRRCLIWGEDEVKQKTGRNFFTLEESYKKCYENKGKTCDAPMLQHFIAYLHVYRRYLEEKDGEYGNMVKKISLPPN